MLVFHRQSLHMNASNKLGKNNQIEKCRGRFAELELKKKNGECWWFEVFCLILTSLATNEMPVIDDEIFSCGENLIRRENKNSNKNGDNNWQEATIIFCFLFFCAYVSGLRKWNNKSMRADVLMGAIFSLSFSITAYTAYRFSV